MVFGEFIGTTLLDIHNDIAPIRHKCQSEFVNIENETRLDAWKKLVAGAHTSLNLLLEVQIS